MNEPDPLLPIVYVVDDDVSFRGAMERVLKAAGFCAQSYGSVVEFMLSRGRGLRGCVLLDVRMPGGASGVEVQRALRRQGEAIPVIFLTGHGTIPMSVQAIKDGAYDFLTKPVDPDLLLETVRKAIASQQECLDAAAARHQVLERAQALLEEERDILQRIASGAPNKEIAADYGCSERTIKTRRARIMKKMQAGSLAELVLMADWLKGGVE